MRITTLAFGTLLSLSMLFAQTDSNSVTVTATRNLSATPDEALFVLNVITGSDATLDDVVATLKPLGITVTNFNGLNSTLLNLGPLGDSLSLGWGFTLNIPIAKLSATIDTLTSLQKSIPKAKRGWQLNFSVQGTQVSAQALQSQTCATSDLISDARAQAQKLATAAGLSLGSILAMSGITPSSIASAIGVPYYGATCSLTVKFALIRF